MPVTFPVVNERKDLVSLIHMGPQGRKSTSGSPRA